MNLLKQIALAWIQYRHFEAALAELRRLSDRQLRDRGLARCDVVRVAFEAAERRTQAAFASSRSRARTPGSGVGGPALGETLGGQGGMAGMTRPLTALLPGAAHLGHAAASSVARPRPSAPRRAPMGEGDHAPAGGDTEDSDMPSLAERPELGRGEAKRAAARGPRFRLAPTLNLALQGGGAHGAFTWGVLDRLLADRRIAFEGVSGASAGAINAVLLASGWLAAGRAGARRALDAFWDCLANLAAASSFQPALGSLTGALSPYQFNPLDLNPLRALLTDLVDFAAIRMAETPRLFLAATRVRTGEARIFRNGELSVEAVLASACLPQLHRAVEIDDEAYWDGGFSSNPPLLPLVEHCCARDLLLVQLSPSEVTELPVTAPAIRGRMSQITFNAPLLHELRALELGARQTGVRLHRIDATPTLAPLGVESAARPDRELLVHLREAGRAAADGWLRARALGQLPAADATAA